MNEELTDVSTKGIVTLHFDVPEHSIPLGQFIHSAQAIKTIIEDFNEHLFDGKLKPNLHVLPPQNGGLLETLWVVLNSGASVVAVMWAFVSSDIGKAYVKGLTGKEPAEIARELGENHRQLFNKDDDGDKANDKIKNKLIAALVAYILAQMTMGFIEKEPPKLEEVGISKKKHRSAYEAKNTIIQTCINNKDVKGLGFSENHEFPIKRTDFIHHIVEVPPEDIEEEINWVAEICDIKVYSPYWKPDGSRLWLGDTSDFSEMKFSIEDAAFWKHVELKDIQPDIHDNLKVQWVHPACGERKPTNLKVLKVLQYNGSSISKPLTDEEVQEIIGDFSHKPPKDQMDLLDMISEEKRIKVQ